MRRLALILMLTSSVAGCQQPTLCDKLRALIQDPSVASAHWGIQVTDLTGQALCSINESQLFRPASNNKIFTTAAALALLGPDHTVDTRLEAEGDLRGDTLHGNLLLIGAGDANFAADNIPYRLPRQHASEAYPRASTVLDIESLADSVFAKGVHSITGDIVGDDTFFAWQPYPPDWEIDDAVFGYGAPISALTIHNNAIDVTVAPSKSPAGKATISLVPNIPYYQIDSSVDAVVSHGDCDDRLEYQRSLGSKRVRIMGDLAPDASPCHQALAIEDPAEYAAIALKLALERRGVRVSGDAIARHSNPDVLRVGPAHYPDQNPALLSIFSRQVPASTRCALEPAQAHNVAVPRARTLLATHTSPTLLEDILYTNKTSQNQHAEVLLRILGATFTCQHAQRDGLHVIREYLLHVGVNPQDIALYDGSGLSTHDLVAPRALTTFLAYAAAQPWFKQFKPTLPQGGVDGGLVSRFKDILPGRIFAKTGTLGESRALSGYVTTNSGRELIFSVMVDDHLPSLTPPPDRIVMDRIIMAIASYQEFAPTQ